MNKRRVVVTGLGLVTPVGIGVNEAWKNIIEGQSGISNITNFDTSGFATPFSSTIAGEVKNFDPKEYLNPKDARRMDTFIQYGLVASL
jgi:3-oxoacyl-[acyl-carrier-protein] synthase II